jgi:hypothetical protein
MNLPINFSQKKLSWELFSLFSKKEPFMKNNNYCSPELVYWRKPKASKWNKINNNKAIKIT